MIRRIAYLQIHNLLPAIVRVLRPEARNRPIAVMSKARVHEVCRIARGYGIRIGSTDRAARLSASEVLCVPIQDLDPHPYSCLIWDICAEYTPLVEPQGYADCYMDLSGCGDAERIAREISRRVESAIEVDSTLSVAGSRLSASVLACTAKEPVRITAPEDEPETLARTPVHLVHLLPPDIRERLIRLGIAMIGDIARIPEGELYRQFGHAGRILEAIAAGKDGSAVKAAYPPPMVRVGQTLEMPIADAIQLGSALSVLVEAAERSLKEQGRTCSSVSVAIGLNTDLGYRKAAAGVRLPSPTSSSGRLRMVALGCIKDLATAPVYDIALTLGDLKDETAPQLSLYGGLAREAKSLIIRDTVDAVRSRCGSKSLALGLEESKTNREQMLDYYIKGVPLEG